MSSKIKSENTKGSIEQSLHVTSTTEVNRTVFYYCFKPESDEKSLLSKLQFRSKLDDILEVHDKPQSVVAN